MSIQTPLDIYSNTLIKNLEHVQNKALVIAPFEITKSGKLDPDLLLDTPGIININLYKKIVAGEDKEPTANQFKTIKYISELDSSNLISTFNIPVIFKYDKETGIRTIEKDLAQVSNNLDYIDFTIDVSNTDLSSETGSNGFYCVYQVQKIQKPASTTAFTEVANDEFLFMIPSVECREIPELVEFDLLDSDNKVINIKKYDEDDNTNIEPSNVADFFGDNSTVACYLFDGNTKDETGFYNGTPTNITYTDGKFDKCAVFNGTSGKIDCTNIYGNCYSLNMWVYLNTQVDSTSDYNILGTWNINESGTWEAIALGSASSMISGETLSIMFTDVGNTNIKFFYIKDIIPQGWNMLTFQWNIRSSNWEIYVNGTSKQIFNSGTPVFKPLNLILGSTPLNVSFYSGKMDNVRIFNRTLTQDEVTSLYKETKSITIQTQKDIDAANQGYRIYPVMKISDHINEETPTTPKYYLGSKYQRNIMDILSQSIKTKRNIYNLKDMYLVDDLCIQTLNKINIQLETDQMIKFSERLYNLGTPLTPLREKLNADVILEYISTPVSGSYNNDLEVTLKTSLIEDYNFTQEEIDNLNDNLNVFKSRARIALATPTIDNDKFRFNLPNTFIDGNRSKTEKKNLLVFGTDSGFDKFNLAGYPTPYSNISKRATSAVLDYDNLVLGLPAIEGANASKIKTVSCAVANTIILYNNGDLFIKGHNGDGQLNLGYRDNSFFRTNFQLIGSEITHATISDRYVAIVKNNRIYGLGHDSGQFGNGNTSGYRYSWYLSSFNPNNQIIKIDSSDGSIAVLLDNGDLYFCGENGRYPAGLNHNSELFYFTKIASNVKDFTLGTYGTFYISDNNDLYYSGLYSYGLAGTGVKVYGVDPTKCYKVFTRVATNVKKVITHNSYPSFMSNICSFYISTNDDLFFTGDSFPNIYPETFFWTKTASNVKDVIRGDKNIGILYKNGDLYLAGDNGKGVFGNFNPGNDTTFYKIDAKVEALADKMNSDWSSYKYSAISYIKDKKLVSSGTNPYLFSGVKSNFIESPQIVISDSFLDILSNYKQQIPFTYIPLSTDIDDMNDKPVFDNLTNITGFYKNNEIIIDIPNIL